MDNPARRPSFLEAWIDDLRDDVRRYGARKLLPWAAIICGCIGYLVAIIVPQDHFWEKPEISIVFFTAAVTINGLLLALSWGSFAKIYEIASEPKLAGWLRRNNLLNQYMFHVDFIHYAQIAALSCSGASLVLCVVDKIPHEIADRISLLSIQRISLAATVATTIYALKYALGAVRIMQDLVWHSAYFEPDRPDMRVHEGGKS
jgi:hypothetical protein